MTGFNIFKKIWLYRAKKQIIKKYNQRECDNTMIMFNKVYSNCQYDMFMIHTSLVQILRDIDFDGIESDLYEYIYRLQQLYENLNVVKRKFVNLFKQYSHCVRMYHWMYTHGHHKKYANVFDDGQTFKMCYKSKIEKYVMEFKPFDISLELKKYKINKRKKELENDFDC